MKKIIAVFMALGIALLSFSACSASKKVTVNGVKISSGVYEYFVAEERKSNAEISDDELFEAVKKDISYYVMVNSEFHNRGLKLSLTEKSAVSQNVNNYWTLFSTYYENAGITKQDIQKVEENKAYMNSLIVSYYGADGESPVTDEELKTYFSENYIAFRAITGFLTTVNDDGTAAMLSDEEKNAMIESFSKYADSINEGSSLEEIATTLENINMTSDTVVIDKTDKNYPDEFFDKVYQIEINKTGAFSIGDYVFVVSRESLEDEEDSLFKAYKTRCLNALKGEEFDSILSEWSKSYEVIVK